MLSQDIMVSGDNWNQLQVRVQRGQADRQAARHYVYICLYVYYHYVCIKHHLLWWICESLFKFRPLSNISAIDIKVMLSDSTLAGCYGDSELKEVSPDIICRPLSNGLDPFENLTAFQVQFNSNVPNGLIQYNCIWCCLPLKFRASMVLRNYERRTCSRSLHSIVLYLSIYIAPFTVHTNQWRHAWRLEPCYSALTNRPPRTTNMISTVISVNRLLIHYFIIIKS